MIIEGMIADVTTKTNPNTKVKTGEFNFLVTKPMQVLKVRLTEDHINQNIHAGLKALEEKPSSRVAVEFKDTKFGDADGKHVHIAGYTFYELLTQVQQNKG